jgi:hypothetical protein
MNIYDHDLPEIIFQLDDHILANQGFKERIEQL